MRKRYCDPATGTFVTEDPVRDGINWYRYADSDPINKFDYFGTSTAVETLEASGEDATLTWSESGGMTTALAIKGKATELALFMYARYAALAALVEGGSSRAGEFAWRFVDAAGKWHLFRFNVADNLLKHNTNGSPLGIKHHQILSDFLKDFADWLSHY
jgi:uncharacterized protein RhaS with RHS repeats